MIITELHYHPDHIDDDTLEFVEIYNSTDAAVDLTGWRIRGGIDFKFPDGVQLGAYETVVVVPFSLDDADLTAAFRAEYELDASTVLLGGYSGRLENAGERVQLQRPDVSPLDEPWFVPHFTEDEVRYDDAAPWPADADGRGAALVRKQSDAWGHDPAGWEALPPTPGRSQFAPTGSSVVGRHIFYNHSTFDGDDPAANAQDDAAVAPDKQPLLPGAAAMLANYTSYSRGINGLMIDVAGLPPGAVISDGDFEFRVGNSNGPTTWAAALDPTSITVRGGEGVDGSDRVTLIWPDNAIQKQWLQVTVLATENSGLTEPDVFHFGNAIGESGNSTTDAKVNAFDMLAARDNQRQFHRSQHRSIDDFVDFNRDRPSQRLRYAHRPEQHRRTFPQRTEVDHRAGGQGWNWRRVGDSSAICRQSYLVD